MSLGLQQLALLTALTKHREATSTELHELLGSFSIPSIVVALDRLFKRKLVDRRKGEPQARRGGRAPYHYTVTNAGRAALIAATSAYGLTFNANYALSPVR